MTPEFADVLTAAIAALGLCVSTIAVVLIERTHRTVNSQLTKMLKLTEDAALAKGAAKGRAEGRAEEQQDQRDREAKQEDASGS